MPLVTGTPDEKREYSLLCNESITEISLHDESRILHHESRLWRRRFYLLLLFSASTTALLIGVAIYYVHTLGTLSCSCPTMTQGVKLPYSPAPVEYINKHISDASSDGYEVPTFMGEPRPELDKAWTDLLAGTMIRYSEEELQLAGNATSIPHKEGGYVGGLGVSHSLHCVKRIKQYLHPEYYYGHEEQDWHELYRHVDHCLEALRQQLLCSADVNVYTLKWTPHSKTKPSIMIPQQNACVNWEVLHGWMLGRAAGYNDLVKPV